MHVQFRELLKQYVFDEKYISVVKYQTEKTFEEIYQGLLDNIRIFKGRITELETTMERLEERHADEEISREFFEKHFAKYREEKKKLMEDLQKLEEKMSNLDPIIEDCVTKASKLDTLWDESSLLMKQKLQSLVFPDEFLITIKMASVEL